MAGDRRFDFRVENLRLATAVRAPSRSTVPGVATAADRTFDKCAGDVWGGTSRSLWALLWGPLSLLIVAAPWLAAHAQPAIAGLIYVLYSPACHQNPERCFALAGNAWAVCHRCSGIYMGLLAAALLPLPRRLRAQSALPRRIWLAAAGAPLLLDVILPQLGMWTNNAASRFVSGFVSALMLALLLLPGLSELLQALSGKRLAARIPWLQGDIP